MILLGHRRGSTFRRAKVFRRSPACAQQRYPEEEVGAGHEAPGAAQNRMHLEFSGAAVVSRVIRGQYGHPRRKGPLAGRQHAQQRCPQDQVGADKEAPDASRSQRPLEAPSAAAVSPTNTAILTGILFTPSQKTEANKRTIVASGVSPLTEGLLEHPEVKSSTAGDSACRSARSFWGHRCASLAPLVGRVQLKLPPAARQTNFLLFLNRTNQILPCAVAFLREKEPPCWTTRRDQAEHRGSVAGRWGGVWANSWRWIMYTVDTSPPPL